nr:hypothetical protein TetV2_00415 [Oceanusvirus sp.]
MNWLSATFLVVFCAVTIASIIATLVTVFSPGYKPPPTDKTGNSGISRSSSTRRKR